MAHANANNNGSSHPSTKAHILVDTRQPMANLAEVAPQSPMPIQRGKFGIPTNTCTPWTMVL